MPAIIRLAFLLEVVALWCERMLGFAKTYLPIGGDHFTQLAALVVFAVICCEFRDVFGKK